MEKKIKICFVQPRAYYLFNNDAKDIKDKVGGAQKQTYLYSIELAKNPNFDVHFLVADFKQANIEKHHNVTVWKSFDFRKNFFKKTFKLFKTLKTINANTYIFRSADTGVAVAIFFIKIFLRKKVLYMLASNVETNFKQLKNMSGFLTALSMNYVYKYADYITVQSKSQYDLFIKHRKRKPDAIIKNIIEIDENTAFKKEDIVLWVGRLAPIKYPELFLETVRSYPKQKFIMIAPVVQDYRSYGKKIKKEAGKIKNLEYIEYVEPEKITLYYQKALIYVITSHFEGFSNTMAEAMANKCAVLSYNVNPDNILLRYKCGLFAKGDKKLFFQQFEELINNKILSQRFGNNGIFYIEKNHQSKLIIKKFTEVLNND